MAPLPSGRMSEPILGYAQAPDGALLAYRVYGDGPTDLAIQLDWSQPLELLWEDPVDRAWQETLAESFRIVAHDRRATGASSRNVPPPTLEQRAADTLTVLDAVGMARPVLFGWLESGSVNALIAGTRPERAAALIWLNPAPRATWAPDYPWGTSPERTAQERDMLSGWGTLAYSRWFVEDQVASGNPFSSIDPERFAQHDRLWATPDIARLMADAWNQTDVRAILPSIQTPTLILAHRDRPDAEREMRYVASLFPQARLELMPGSAWAAEDARTWIEVIRSFVGIERPPTDLDTVLATVLFTDIVGSTERQAAVGDRAWKTVVERHHDLVRRELDRWRGTERDTAGDGFFATFDGPARAVRCALEIRERVRDLGLEIRAGVHTGECEIVDRKVGGLAVSIGARVAATAGPSEVLVSQTVKDLVAGSGLTFSDAGERELKGVPDRWHLWQAAAA